jgi:hypothetical protein
VCKVHHKNDGEAKKPAAAKEDEVIKESCILHANQCILSWQTMHSC